MKKHAFLFPLLCAALVAGILVCLGLIARTLISAPRAAVYAGAQFVREAISHAAV